MLNAALIFVVLFYVYPLKFLFTLAVGSLSGGRTVPVEQLTHMVSTTHQLSQLWLIYSAGVIAVYGLFALLYHYAYRMRGALELNEYETLSTRNAIIHFAGLAGVGVAVAIAALVLPSAYVGYAGFLFCLNAVWDWAAGSVLGNQQRLVLERMKAQTASKAVTS